MSTVITVPENQGMYHSPSRQQERQCLGVAWGSVLTKYILIGLIAASSLLNFYLFEFSTIQNVNSAHPLSNSTIKQRQNHVVDKEDGPYTTDALRRNPYLGWQPPQQRTIANFSWIDCISNTAEYTGKAPDKDGSSQPLGCLERPSQLGKSGFSLDKYNETSWIPDVTMLRTMLMHGKDIRGHPYPPRLPRELCRDIILPDQKSTIDEDKHCFREAKIKPTGLLGTSTVTISPWNHFGGSQHHNKTSLTVPAPKVLCMVYTVKNSHSTNIRAIRDTWGGGCDGFLAFSSAPDPRLPAIALQHEGPESYDNMWSKVRSIWKYVGKHYLNDFDWFFIGGDDMFVLPNNLRTYLASLAYKDGYADPRSKEYYVGRRFHNKVMEMKLKKRGKFPRNGTLHFNTGGSGYALSQGSLRKFLTVVDDAEHCFSTEKTSAEDVMMARCLHYLGIRVTDTRDVQGRERFHMFMPGRLFNWRNFAKRNNWYLDFNPWGLKNESDCCAPDSVSFHYAKQPALVRHLHALLYHCNSSDSAQPMRNDDPVHDKSRNISAEIPFASVHNDYAIGISDNQLSNSTNNKTAEETSKEIMINMDYEDLSGGFKNHPHMSALDEQNNRGYVHDVESLSRNPPKFVFQEKDIACEHNDATMQLLTQRVYVDLDADKRADRLSKEGVKPPRAKIFCHIYTTKKSHDRIQAIRETWGQRCDGFLAASDVTDISIDAVNILHEGQEKYENMWQKVRSMWSYVYDNYYQDYDWFHIGGDDMYVLVENLRLYLESEEILVASNGGKPLANDKSPSKKQHPLLIGSIFRNDGNEQETFVTGGGGYTLNKAGLKALVMSFDSCCPHNVTSAEDLLVSYCLNQQGINIYEGKDQNGADRYHHTNPEFIFNFAPQKNPLFWYTYYSTNTNAGVNHTAERPVSFHLKDEFKVFRRGSRRGNKAREGSSFGWSIKRVHAILYGYCDNISRGRPMATTGWKDGKITFNHWKHPQRKCDLEKKAEEICICSEKKVNTRTIMTCVKKQDKDLKSLTSITTTPTASPTKHANLLTSPTTRTVG